jgi:hypothetical protein
MRQLVIEKDERETSQWNSFTQRDRRDVMTEANLRGLHRNTIDTRKGRIEIQSNNRYPGMAESLTVLGRFRNLVACRPVLFASPGLTEP